MSPTTLPNIRFVRRFRPSLAAVACTVALVACESAVLTLPPGPTTTAAPVITGFEPVAAFGESELRISGSGFDPEPANNTVVFPGGLIAPGVRFEDGRLVVVVPQAQSLDGPLALQTLAYRSAPSETSFVPLGYGHPVFGTLVAELRFRHRPVGLIDSPDAVVLASTLLDLLVTDSGGYALVDGRPVLLRRMADGRAWLSVEGAGGGILSEVEPETGHPLAKSTVSEVVEHFVLPPGDASHLLRTVGVDPYGRVTVARWTREGGTLAATRTSVDVTAVKGATATADGSVLLVATIVSDARSKDVLLRVREGGYDVVWEPDGERQEPTGPVVVTTTAAGPVAVLGLSAGDLGFLNLRTGAFEQVVMVSFGAVGDLREGKAPGKVVLTKPLDGAVFQFDVERAEIDWTVQVRGEPSTVDVAFGFDEVAVANAEENVVDFIDPVSGTWLGRASFALGLGAAEGYEGGGAMAFSYSPEAPERPVRYELLARTARMVLVLDPASLDLQETWQLAEGRSEPLRLAVTPDLRTLVVHRRELGILEAGAERIVATELRAVPTSIAFMGARVLLPSLVGVEVLEWTGEGAEARLVSMGFWRSPAGTTLRGLHVVDGGVAVVRQTQAGTVVDVHTVLTLLGSGAPVRSLTVGGGAAEFVGSVSLLDGPAIAFARSDLPGAALYSWAAIDGGTVPPIRSIADRPLLLGSTPDGRFITWIDDGTGEHMVRLLQYVPQETPYRSVGVWTFASYRLGARAAGPVFDPSGEWMYVPVPKLDELVVLQ